MKDPDILNNAPADATNYSMEAKQYWDWPRRTVKTVEFGDLDSTYPDDFRSLADIKELVQLRQENAYLQTQSQRLKVIITEREASIDELEAKIKVYEENEPLWTLSSEKKYQAYLTKQKDDQND
jgi:hypothetical protein